MNHVRMRLSNDITFHTFLPWFLIKLVVVLLIGMLCLGLALSDHHLWWLGVLVVTTFAVVLATSYSMEAVILRSDQLVFRWGSIWLHEHGVPLDQVALDIEQSFLGRVFDYGTVRQHLGPRIILLHDVANIRALRLLLAERRRHLAHMEQGYALLPVRSNISARIPAPSSHLYLPSTYEESSP